MHSTQVDTHLVFLQQQRVAEALVGWLWNELPVRDPLPRPSAQSTYSTRICHAGSYTVAQRFAIHSPLAGEAQAQSQLSILACRSPLICPVLCFLHHCYGLCTQRSPEPCWGWRELNTCSVYAYSGSNPLHLQYQRSTWMFGVLGTSSCVVSMRAAHP